MKSDTTNARPWYVADATATTIYDGVWRCEDCGERSNGLDARWRWTGTRWEHHHGYPVGHIPARYFGPDITHISDEPEAPQNAPSEGAADDVRVLFAVTTLHGGDPLHWRPRTPGIFTTLEQARDVVTRNVLDLHECYYEYAVIETIAADTLYPPVHEAYATEWYRWTGERYERCDDKPDDFTRGVGFSIG